MPVRMVFDGDSEEEYNNENSQDYSHLVGKKIYVGKNTASGVVLYTSPTIDSDFHADLSPEDLANADHFIGKGERIEENSEGTWLKLAYQKPVWLLLNGQDIDSH